MKVVHVITGLGDGGAEAAMARLIECTPEIEHRVVSLTGIGKYKLKLDQLNVKTHVLDARGPAKVISSLFLLRGILKSERPSVVQCWMYHADLIGGIAARLAGVRAIVWNLRSVFSPEWKRVLRFIFTINARISYLIPSKIVACSDEVNSAHRALGYDSTKMTTINNGLDTTRFKRDDNAAYKTRRELGVEVDEFLIGRVGRLAPQKDYRTFLAALAELRDRGSPVRAIIVGHGTEIGSKEFDEMVERAGVAHLLLRLGARSDVEAILNAVDIHVSTSSVEGFPNVLAEAMACETPCVTTGAGNSEEIIGSHGWLTAMHAPSEIATAIELAISEFRTDRSSWDQRRAAGASHIRNKFTMEAMAEAYCKVWMKASEKSSV